MRFRFPEGRGLPTLVLTGAFIWSLTTVPWGDNLTHPGGGKAFLQFLGAALTPEVSFSFLRIVFEASWTTIAYATASITLAVALGFPLGVIASGVLARSAPIRLASIVGVRSILAFLRSIHELVWAWLFVVAFGLSPIAGVIAIAVPYGGILGRIYSELLQDVPQEPLRALRASGATEWKVFLYGRLPMALPDMVSYGCYRWECAIRSAAILSFVGIPGLGYQIQLSMMDLHYDEVWTLFFFLVAIVTVVDAWSNGIRRSLVA
ncbi:MAG: transporter permease [Dehalococcoidia bacterium]|nr:transporter permease [Dehalococcoidia bacterium]